MLDPEMNPAAARLGEEDELDLEVGKCYPPYEFGVRHMFSKILRVMIRATGEV